MSILRDISRAKTLLRAVGSITQIRLPAGSAVVQQGDLGDSMYTVVEVRGFIAGTNNDTVAVGIFFTSVPAYV